MEYPKGPPEGYVIGQLSASHNGSSQALVEPQSAASVVRNKRWAPAKRELSSAQREQRMKARRLGGLASTAKLGRRDRKTGRMLSAVEMQRREMEWLTWLYAKPGRAGGVQRALTANRYLGMFWRNDLPEEGKN